MNTTTLSAADALGTFICDVAEGRRSLSDLLEIVQNWQDDMAAREAATRRMTPTPGTDAMAVRARGMYLASLALATRIEAAIGDTPAPSPVRIPR